MGATRRGFLGRGAGLAAGVVAGASTAAGATTAGRAALAAQAAYDDWEWVRAQFALTPDYRHFGGLLLAAHPAPVRAAIEAHRRGLDENPVDYLRQNQGALENSVLASGAAYFGVRPADIALTDSTTMGLGVLYNGLPLGPGDDALTTEHDFFATHDALAFKAARSGSSVRRVRLYDRPPLADSDQMVERLVAAVVPQTRVVAVTWVHSSTGVKLPIRRFADALADLGRQRGERVLLSVDGVHGLGVEDETLASLGCDFLVAGCHKWLFGPRGTGVIVGRPEAWTGLTATIPSFSGHTRGSELTPGGFHSFEHRWALAEAFRFHQAIGKPRVAERIHALHRQLKEGLASLPNVTLQTPMSDDLSAGLVCFEVRGYSADGVVAQLHDRYRVIATVTPYTPRYARLAPGLLNSPEEVDQALAAVRALT